MKTSVQFYTDASTGNDCVLHLSVSGSKERVIHILKEALRDIEVHGKPIQGCVSAFNGVSHVITPVWNGKEY